MYISVSRTKSGQESDLVVYLIRGLSIRLGKRRNVLANKTLKGSLTFHHRV